VTYWPFWLGAFALAGITLAHLALLRRPMGVSGSLTAALDPGERRAEQESADISESDLEAALAAATLAAFGDVGPAPETAPTAPEAPRLGRPLVWSTQVRFLVGIVGGAAVSALLAGRAPSFDLDATYRTLVGSGALGYAALFFGGILVGVGTRMAAGCTSGHGLVGCGSIRPGSIVATCCFFGTGIAVSMLLAAAAR